MEIFSEIVNGPFSVNRATLPLQPGPPVGRTLLLFVDLVFRLDSGLKFNQYGSGSVINFFQFGTV